MESPSSTVISRRKFLKASALCAGAPFVNRGRYGLFAGDQRQYCGLTLDLINSSTVIDMLGLLTLDYRKLWTWQSSQGAFRTGDVEMLKASGITVFHPAVGFTQGDVHASSLRDLTNWNLFLASHPGEFLRISQAGDLGRAKTEGKIGVILGLQNSAHFRTVADVDFFYRLGQRVSQLTYYDNRLGGGAGTSGAGLSAFGAEVVARMNELGMAVDVSHCSDRTTLDAAELSRKPVLVTHSNCRALVPHNARCKRDEVIRKVAATGGVFGVTMVRPFVRSAGAATLEHVLDHIDHAVAVAGVDSVGVGTDVDLVGREPGGARTSDLDGLRYPRKIFELTEGLVRRRYRREDIVQILGGNFQRALAAIWTA